MGRRGPQPKPRAAKERDGTYKPSREPVRRTPNPPVSLPAPPPQLELLARREWDRVGAILVAQRLVTEGDLSVLTEYCLRWAKLWRYEEILRQKGETYEANELVKVRPEVKLREEMLQGLARASARLGLSPADRTRVSMIGEDDGGEAQDPAKAYLS